MQPHPSFTLHCDHPRLLPDRELHRDEPPPSAGPHSLQLRHLQNSVQVGPWAMGTYCGCLSQDKVDTSI